MSRIASGLVLVALLVGPASAGPDSGPSASPAKAGAEGKDAGAQGKVNYDHKDAPAITAVRTMKKPKIDGVLDDAIWRTIPPVTDLWNELSKPYGQKTNQPTKIRVAYDDHSLYIGVECGYEKPHEPEDNAQLIEMDATEFFAAYIDAEHDHASTRVFMLTPRGYRADWESFNNGALNVPEWSGLWDGKTTRTKKGWSAEFEIPWGTLSIRGRGPSPTIGLNFRRYVHPTWAIWSLAPPGSPRPKPSFFGHLTGLEGIDPGQIIALVPYMAIGATGATPSYRNAAPISRLHDFDGDKSRLVEYAGLYGRLEPGLGARVDFMINPDFSQVVPDSAVANLDRFELFFPEVRPFFVEAAPNFGFGLDRYQLFYSRRIGLRKRIGGFDEVPIYYGAAASLRRGGTSIGVLDLYNQKLAGPFELGVDTTVYASHVTVARAQQSFGGETRLGAMLLNQSQPWGGSAYRALGLDGSLGLYGDHLVLSGFGVRSDKLELDPTSVPTEKRFDKIHDYAVSGSATWQSHELEASASYLDVGDDFRADLGFFERVGVKRSTLTAFYKPQIQSDFIRSARIGPSLTHLVNRDTDGTEVQRLTIMADASLLDRATFSAAITQTIDGVHKTFYVAGHRIGIQPGTYTGTLSAFSFLSAPRQRVQIGGSFLDGDYFGGYQRVISPEIQFNYQTFAARATYQHYYIHPGPNAIVSLPNLVTNIQGDRLSLALLLAVTPNLRLSTAVELNTLDPTATTQAIASWRIDGLSNVVIVASRFGPGVDPWAHEPFESVLAKFSYGVALP